MDSKPSVVIDMSIYPYILKIDSIPLYIVNMNNYPYLVKIDSIPLYTEDTNVDRIPLYIEYRHLQSVLRDYCC